MQHVITSLSTSVAAWSDGLVRPLVGGLLIGAAAALLLGTIGRVAGVSGILGGLFPLSRVNTGLEARWRSAFVLGLLSVGLVAAVLAPASVANTASSTTTRLVIGGLLVGFGTRLGSGCTSGHGVCGISRFSARSLVATLTFIAAGVATSAVVSAFGGLL